MATSEDGGPKGRTILVDDCENTVFEGKAHGDLPDEPMGQTPRAEQYQNTDLLQQMTISCQTMQNLCKQMQEGFAGRDDYNKMEQTMTAKMEQGFRSEKTARQQTQDKIKHMVKKDQRRNEKPAEVKWKYRAQ